MPIDTSLYSRIALPDFADKGAEGFQNGMQMRTQMDQARRNNDAEAMKRNSADALRNSMVTGPDGSRTLDTKRAASNLFGVDPMQGLAFQKEAQNEEIEKQKAIREKQKFEVDLTAQLAGSVKDQASWDNALVTAQKYGIDTAQLPKQYDPNFVKMIHGRALSAKEQLDATYKVQDFQLREKELGSRAADRAEARNERRFQAGIKIGDKRQERIETDVQKLSDKLGNAQEMQKALSGVESTLGFKLDDANVTDGKLVVNGQQKDLPGVSLPGMGRTSFYDTKARTLSSSVAKVFNTELKDRSGAAVTTPELERLKEEFGSGKYNTESEMVGALQSYKQMVAAELKNREAAFRPEVIKTYESRGGATSKAIGATKGSVFKTADIEWAD